MGDFRIGSVFGFEIRIDYSWFIIFFLILWTFTVAVFPGQFPGLGLGVYIGMGVAGTLLFFVSLLTHELSHSLVARTRGIPVEGITLFIFGGIARTRMEAESPGDEFLIAGVGPLVSFLIAGVLWAVAWVGASAGWSIAVIGVARYLALLNFVLAVFNLLPGFPLDGGRLFRAAAWKVTGDATRATRYATTGGKWLGYALIGLGVYQVLQGALIGGLWSAFIGWFLRNAAFASYQQHLLMAALEEVRAQDAMTRDPQTVPPDLTLQQLVDDYFMHSRFRSYPVTEDERPVGLITLGLVKEVPREEWAERTVRATMLPAEDGVTVGPEERLSRVLEKLESSEAGRVLVTRDGHLEGIITASDVTDWVRRTRELRES